MQFKDRDLRQYLEYLYGNIQGGLTARERIVTCWRPLYAPVKEVLEYIPPGASVLDVGCGSGPLLFLARRYCNIKEGLGIDINCKAVNIARRANRFSNVQFSCNEIYGYELSYLQRYNVIVCFDLLHHIKKDEQLPFLNRLMDILINGSFLIIKDLDDKALIRCFLNRITDFLSTRSYVDYVGAEYLQKYLSLRNLRIVALETINKITWKHYIIVAQK